MRALHVTNAILRREWSAYFESPLAFVFLIAFLLLAGIFTFTLGGFFERGDASLAAFFNWMPWLFLFLVPAVGMRLWSEERRLGTIELLLTMPITPWQAILGKFLASWAFLILAIALSFPIVLSVNWLGSPDNGMILAGYVGCALLAGSYLSIACLASACTRNQVIAFIFSIMACLVLNLLGFPPVLDLISRWVGPSGIEAIAGFSTLSHFDGFQKGILDTRDVVYFCSIAIFSLFVTGVVLRGHRAG